LLITGATAEEKVASTTTSPLSVSSVDSSLTDEGGTFVVVELLASVSGADDEVSSTRSGTVVTDGNRLGLRR